MFFIATHSRVFYIPCDVLAFCCISVTKYLDEYYAMVNVNAIIIRREVDLHFTVVSFVL